MAEPLDLDFAETEAQAQALDLGPSPDLGLELVFGPSEERSPVPSPTTQETAVPAPPSDAAISLDIFEPPPLALDLPNEPLKDRTALETTSDILSSFGTSLKASFQKGITAAHVKGAGRTLADIADGVQAPEIIDESGDIIYSARGPVSNIFLDGVGLIAQFAGLDDEAKRAAEAVTGYGEALERSADADMARAAEGGFANEVAAAVGGSLGIMAPSAAVAVATGGRSAGAMLGSIGYFTYADAYNEGLNEGLSSDRASLYAGTEALIETATEALPLKALFKQDKFLKKLAGFMVREVPGELLATTLQEVNDWISLNPEMSGRDFAQRLQHSLAITAVSTPITGGLQAGAVRTLEKVSKGAFGTKEEVLAEPEELTPFERLQQAIAGEFFHGTDRAYVEYREEAIGTGEKTHDEGVGIYKTPSFEIAQGYAERQSRRTGGQINIISSDITDDMNIMDLSTYESLPGEFVAGMVEKAVENGAVPDVETGLQVFDAGDGTYISGHEFVELMRQNPASIGELTNDMKALGLDGIRYQSPSNERFADQLGQDIRNLVLFNPRGASINMAHDLPYKIETDRMGPEDELTVSYPDHYGGANATLRFNPSSTDGKLMELRGAPAMTGQLYDQGALEDMLVLASREAAAQGYEKFRIGTDRPVLALRDAVEGTEGAQDSLVEVGDGSLLYDLANGPGLMTRAERLTLRIMDAREGKISEATEELAAGDSRSSAQDFMAGLIGKIMKDKKAADAARADLDQFGKVADWTITNTWMGQINKHIPGVTNFGKHIREWWTTKNAVSLEANRRLESWQQSVPAKGRKAFGEALFEMSKYNDLEGTPMPREQKLEMLEERGLDPELLNFAEEIFDDFRASLAPMEKAAMKAAVASGDPAAPGRVRRRFEALRARDYMPHSRFGKYTVVGKAKRKGKLVIEGEDMRGRENVFFEAFASQREARKAADALRKKYGKEVDFQTRVMDDTVRQFQGLPPELLTIIQSKLDLTADQQQDLRNLALQLGPGSRIAARMLERARVPGFSQDARRVYADYFQRMSNHIARVEHNDTLQEDIKAMQDSLKLIRNEDAIARTGIIKWHRDMFEYLNNPGSELSWFRSLAFTWHLGFNVKSAAVNLTQLPLVSMPYLQTRYGTVEGTKALLASMEAERQIWRKGKDYKSENHRSMINELTMRGIVDESQASELAAVTEGSSLIDDLTGSEAPGRAIRRLGEASSYMFSVAEKFNRRVTAVAAYDLARADGKTHAQAVDLAHEAVELTQAEYARFNRPRAARGKAGVFLVFMQYVNHMLWFTRHDPSQMRYLAMLLFSAGAMGLPFAEDMVELLNLGATKIAQKADPGANRVNIEEYTRNFVDQINDAAGPWEWAVPDGDTLMRGASGAWTPFDMQASVSMGNILPIDGIGREGYRPGSGVLADVTEQAAGAAIAIPVSILNAIGSSSPDIWKRTEMGLPAAARNVSRAVRYGMRGEEVMADGTTQLVEFNPNEWRTFVELAGQATGFPIRRASVAREARWQASQAVQYWNGRRGILLKAYHYGFSKDDGEYLARVRDRIQEFNKGVPFPEVQITRDDLNQSLRSRELRGTMVERDIGPSKRYRGLYKETLDAFGDPVQSGSESAQPQTP